MCSEAAADTVQVGHEKDLINYTCIPDTADD